MLSVYFSTGFSHRCFYQFIYKTVMPNRNMQGSDCQWAGAAVHSAAVFGDLCKTGNVLITDGYKKAGL